MVDEELIKALLQVVPPTINYLRGRKNRKTIIQPNTNYTYEYVHDKNNKELQMIIIHVNTNTETKTHLLDIKGIRELNKMFAEAIIEGKLTPDKFALITENLAAFRVLFKL